MIINLINYVNLININININKNKIYEIINKKIFI